MRNEALMFWHSFVMVTVMPGSAVSAMVAIM
jgi:hypothetical protein